MDGGDKLQIFTDGGRIFAVAHHPHCDFAEQLETPLQRKLFELADIRLDIETHAIPDQAIRIGPVQKFLVAVIGLVHVFQVEPVALLPGKQQPGDHGDAGLVQIIDNLGPGGREVQDAQAQAGIKLLQVFNQVAPDQADQGLGLQFTKKGQIRSWHTDLFLSQKLFGCARV